MKILHQISRGFIKLIKVAVGVYLVLVALVAIVASPALIVPLACRWRPVEFLMSGVWTVLFAIPMALIALAIRLDSPGGAIFRQVRSGRGGAPFTMLKFRTMRCDSDPYGVSPQGSDDARLTGVGRSLREASLDELPQLLNILNGTMAFVGPRPLYERQAAEWNAHQRRRLEVLPGLTGYAQAYGRAALTMEDKLDLDIYYVDHRTFLLDLKVIFRTIWNIFDRGDGVYEQRYSRNRQRETDSSQTPPNPSNATEERRST